MKTSGFIGFNTLEGSLQTRSAEKVGIMDYDYGPPFRQKIPKWQIFVGYNYLLLYDVVSDSVHKAGPLC